ncbi:hypothetical protein OROHE_018119 [Orobanche hederae]
MPSQEILKIRDEEKSGTDSIFKIRPSQEILKIRDGTSLEAEEILTYIKNPRNGSVWYVSSMLDVPSNVVQKKRVTRILFFKIRPSQEILKIRDGTHLEAEEILTYIKKPSKRIEIPKICDVQKKRVARILFFKIRPSQEILKIRDGTTLEMKRVTRILFFKIRPSHEILKIRDGTHFEAEEILTYIKKPSKRIGLALYSKLDIPSNVVQKKRVARILFFKIRTSQEIPKICDGTPLEAEEILKNIKKPSKRIVQKKRVARILFFKIRPSQEILKIRDGTTLEMKRVTRILFFKIRPSHEILKIRDGTHLEAEEILTYIKKPSKRIGLALYSKLDIPSNVVQKKRVARILFFKIRTSQEIPKICDGTPLEAEEILTYIKKPSKRIEEKSGTDSIFKIRPSQEILKIRDGTSLEAEEILTYIKNPRNGSVWYVSSKLDVPSNVVQKKRVTRILFFKIRPSQEILKIRDGTHLEAEEILTYIKKPSKRIVQKKRVAHILFFKIRTSQEILKICDGTHLEAEEILTYIKNPRNGSVWYVSSKLDVPSNVVQKKRVTRILFFKIRPSQEILKIRDGTHLEAEEILTYIKKPSKRIVQKKRVARILFFKIRPSQEILKIRDGTTLEMKRVTRILFFKIRPSHEILKIRDGTHLEAEEILTYIKKPSKRIGLALYSKLDIPSNVVQKKRVARILFFKIRTSQEIPKICDGTPLEAEEILTYIEKPSKRIEEKSGTDSIFKIRPSQEILKIRDGTPLEAEEILTYLKNPRNGSVWYVSSKLDVPSNVVQKKRVTRILFFKIRPSQEILKIRDGTHLEAEEILTYIKKPSKRIGLALL